MPFIPFRRVILSFSLALLAGIAAYASRAYSVALTQSNIPTAQSVEKPDRAVVQELLTLRRSGFDPSELVIPSGNFMLAVDNLTGIPDIALTLAEDKKSKIKDLGFTEMKRDWREELEMKPGVYILSEVSHPEWICRITVTDKVRDK